MFKLVSFFSISALAVETQKSGKPGSGGKFLEGTSGLQGWQKPCSNNDDCKGTYEVCQKKEDKKGVCITEPWCALESFKPCWNGSECVGVDPHSGYCPKCKKCEDSRWEDLVCDYRDQCYYRPCEIITNFPWKTVVCTPERPCLCQCHRSWFYPWLPTWWFHLECEGPNATPLAQPAPAPAGLAGPPRKEAKPESSN